MMAGAFRRGDVVIVDFTPTAPAAQIRPALVVQNDRDNARMKNTIVVQLTTNTSRASEATQHLIDGAHPDWSRSGLRLPSAVNCSNLATIAQRDITRAIGSLSAHTMQRIDAGLKSALGLR
ncbi:MAG: type II toxin-antitoxin system PemK/MazF family toxin [Planctomycetales bacterium]